MSDEQEGAQETPDVPLPPPAPRPGEARADAAPTHAELKAKSDAAIFAAIDKFDTDHDDDGDLHVAEPKAEGEEAEGDEDAPEYGEDLEDAADEGEQASAEEGDEPADDADEDKEADEEAQLHRAWNALLEHEVPASVLKNMPTAKLIAWGMKVIEKGKAPGGARTDSTQPDASDPTAAKKDGPGEAAQPARTDWSTATKAFAEELGVDEDAASKALKPLLDRIDQLSEQVGTATGKAEAATNAALARQGQAEIEAQMTRLTRKYPEIAKDAERAEAILEEARTLAAGMKASGKKIDPVSLFDKAALLVNGKPKRSDLRQLKRNGSSTPPNTRPDKLSAPASNGVDYIARVLDEIDAGRPDEARRIRPPKQSTGRW